MEEVKPISTERDEFENHDETMFNALFGIFGLSRFILLLSDRFQTPGLSQVGSLRLGLSLKKSNLSLRIEMSLKIDMNKC